MECEIMAAMGAPESCSSICGSHAGPYAILTCLWDLLTDW